MQDLTRCCYRLFDSDLFQTNMLSISDAIIDRAIQVSFHRRDILGFEWYILEVIPPRNQSVNGQRETG